MTANERHFPKSQWQVGERQVLTALCLAIPIMTGAFKDLTSRQRKSLEPFAGEWNNFSGEKQDCLRKGADRWLEMTAGQRAETGKRFQRWQVFLPGQKARFKQRFFLADPHQPTKLLEYWDSATPEERHLLLDRWKERRPGD